MTREEAVDFGKIWLEMQDEDMRSNTYKFLVMAIEALEQQPCEDAISRQAALNVVHKYFEHYLQLNDDICLDGLRSLPSIEPKEKTEWILVSERLPEINKEVIVTDIETIDTYTSCYLADGYWRCDNGPFKDRIIAWMPLPEPYKEV